MILKLEDESEIVEVRFFHFQNQVPQQTVADVTLSGNRSAFKASAICSPHDQFNKSIGRKVALARAIRTLPRGVRKQIWKAYFDFVNGASSAVR